MVRGNAILQHPYSYSGDAACNNPRISPWGIPMGNSHGTFPWGSPMGNPHGESQWVGFPIRIPHWNSPWGISPWGIPWGFPWGIPALALALPSAPSGLHICELFKRGLEVIGERDTLCGDAFDADLGAINALLRVLDLTKLKIYTDIDIDLNIFM